MKPSLRREMAKASVDARQVSISLACRLFVVSETCCAIGHG
ncbi:hypothetical protein GPAL_2704 [Glaciecola pallidula DSM 14239 = ACAM 615]|uniref:Uncharacterized protein n=1 Tax=Brumicola pallidula DSM 14239 = ACAM 615 TaxID=1121922 RepID=K7A207_9ALTE|nr:hypothetical protein GPAL_2704 [Glaciecola pallidula DSM 14239 = ACAM 615]